jgi:hypothetical protein
MNTAKLAETEKGETGEEQGSRRWQVRRSVPHAVATFCGHCMKMHEDFATKFGDRRTGCCITIMHHLTLFHLGIFDNKQHDCLRPLTLFARLGLLRLFSVSPIEDTAILTKLR